METLDYGTQPVLKLKRSRQSLEASKRLAFELSQYSTQQEILQTLVDLEKELPLESLEVAEFVIRTLWERFYETKDAVVRVKVVSLLGSVARFPGVNINAIAEDLIKLLNADRESRNIGNITCLCYFRLSMPWTLLFKLLLNELCKVEFEQSPLLEKRAKFLKMISSLCWDVYKTWTGVHGPPQWTRSMDHP